MRVNNLLYLARSAAEGLARVEREAKRLTSSIYDRFQTHLAGCGQYGWNPRNEEHTLVPCMTFRDYMNICLYDDKFGYYRSGAARIGKAGDFYTSSAVGSIMGEKLASAIQDLVNRFGGSADLAEWAAGTGRLSGQIVAQLQKEQPSWLPDTAYALVDHHPEHLELARRSLAETGARAVHVLTEEQAMQGSWRRNPNLIVFANELLDALPVHLVIQQAGELLEIGVAMSAVDHEPLLHEVFMPLSDPAIARSLREDGVVMREGQRAEVNLEAAGWVNRMGSLIGTGALILIDYGHEADEMTAEHRQLGTLLCYSGHQAHDRPYILPGRQDITAHVNFSAVRRYAQDTGFKPVYYATQKQFLVDYGVLDDLQQHMNTDPFSEQARRNRSIRQLLLSDGMSEAFKVMILQKGQM